MARESVAHCWSVYPSKSNIAVFRGFSKTTFEIIYRCLHIFFMKYVATYC